MSEEKILRARNVMKVNVPEIDGMATAREAAHMMRESRTTALLVQKRHPDDAWGIVVVQDLIRGVVITGRSPDDVNVYEVMTKPIITVSPEMDIKYVARLIYKAGIHRAPVEENGELIGMVTMTSLVLESKLF